MSSKAINMIDNTVSILELQRMIPLYGPKLTILIQSEPGCGKTSIIKAIAANFGDKWQRAGDYFPSDKYHYIYVPITEMDIPDIGMYVPNHEEVVLKYYFNDLFAMKDPRPKVIMVDEFMKAPKMLQTAMTRLFLERTIGNQRLPEGSIVFATSNNQSDGLMDATTLHISNRIMIQEMRKPTVPIWQKWAADNRISPLVCAWVEMNPSCLASYRDGNQENNAMIFNPASRNLSYVTPRSLEASSTVVGYLDALGHEITHKALNGTIGSAGGGSLAMFLKVNSELVPPKNILADPKNVRLSDKPIVLMTTMFNLADAIETQDDLTNAMVFVNRINSAEIIQGTFFRKVTSSNRTSRMAGRNTQLMDWTKKNYQLLM